MSWLSTLESLAVERERAGLRRTLVPRPPADGVVDLAGNDYLGLARDPRVVSAAVEAARLWGAGAAASTRALVRARGFRSGMGARHRQGDPSESGASLPDRARNARSSGRCGEASREDWARQN